MKIGFVFSGQGAQYTGMGQDLYDEYPLVKSYFDRASAVLGYDMAELVFTENDRLDETEYTQPAILTVSVALYALILEQGIRPAALAGLSLGEYSALVAAGALSFEEAVQLVAKRGRFMSEAVPSGVGAMSAILGTTREQVEALCLKATEEAGQLVTPANYNMPGQIAIAGYRDAVEKAEELASDYGVKRAIRLNVSGPFHTPLLAKAADQLAAELTNVTFHDFELPIATNFTGKVIASKEALPETLKQQVQSPVRFEECIETMLDMGIDTFIEIGPGKALSGFIRKIRKGTNVQNVENQATFTKMQNFVAKLSETEGGA